MSSLRSQDNKVYIVILGSQSFPNGMAATQRVRLISRALIEKGAHVMVLCTRVTERPPIVENQDPIGECQGILYEYTTGTTARSPYFLTRRWIEIVSLIRTVYRLFRLWMRGQLQCVYLYGMAMDITAIRLVVNVMSYILGFPVLVELTERPWSLKSSPRLIERLISPLDGTQGVITISSFLTDWVKTESRKSQRYYPILQMPILVDTNELHLGPTIQIAKIPNVLFAGSPTYDETINFILDSMAWVWKVHPECQLIITGCRPNDPASMRLQQEVQNRGTCGKVEIAGYLSRVELLQRYMNAWALLIPLFDDVCSRARFPTKLGEYLSSARPVITSYIGEIPRYLVNGINAFVCKPGDSHAYGEMIVDVIDNPGMANLVGLAGRDTVEQYFQYSIYGEPLFNFIHSQLTKTNCIL